MKVSDKIAHVVRNNFYSDGHVYQTLCRMFISDMCQQFDVELGFVSESDNDLIVTMDGLTYQFTFMKYDEGIVIDEMKELVDEEKYEKESNERYQFLHGGN